MKLLKLLSCACIIMCAVSVSASDPGPNYACWGYSGNKFYTTYWKGDTNPSWGATQYHFYYDSGVINGSYPTVCSQSIASSDASIWTSAGLSCFINIDGTITQGNLGTINYTNFACPLDDHIWLIALLTGLLSFLFFRKNQVALTMG